ncbi:MAG: glycosyltransferase [Granulosicoccus sp.]
MKHPVVALCIEELSVGGAEQMLVTLANDLAQRNWRVHMVCLRQAGELASSLDNRIAVHVLNKKKGIDATLPWRLLRCIRTIRPDIVNSHLWVANTWVRLSLMFFAVPVIVTEHSRDTWKPRYYRWIDQWLARRTSRLVAVSDDVADFYRQDVSVRPELITTIHNGIDSRRYAQGCGKLLRQAWLGDNESQTGGQLFLIGTVGRLVPAKNHKRLLDCLSILCRELSLKAFDIRLVIAGDGPEYSALEQQARALGLQHRISLVGSRSDIPDVLDAFDLFVLSSDREGYPLTALEAQAAGTPVVLTAAGGSGEAIARAGEQVGGALVTRDPEAMAAAVSQMILDPLLRQRQASFARAYASSHFDKQHMTQRYENLFISVRDHRQEL